MKTFSNIIYKYKGTCAQYDFHDSYYIDNMHSAIIHIREEDIIHGRRYRYIEAVDWYIPHTL